MKKVYPWRPADKYNSFNESLSDNTDTYFFYLDYMTNIYYSLYDWKNLPPEWDQRYIEMILLKRAGIAVFKDEVIGLVVLPFVTESMLNLYENPSKIHAYSLNSQYNIQLTEKDYEIIWTNRTRIPPIMGIKFFAQQMYEIVTATKVNIKGQKNPRIVPANESQKLTMDNLIKEIDGNVSTIMVKDMEIGESLKPIDITVPYTADKLDVHKHQVWNEFLTWCGIENANQDKKERLVSSEVNSNYGNVEMSRNTGLMCRQEACIRINNHFGTNIWVEFNSNIPTLLNEGYKDNGNIYDNID